MGTALQTSSANTAVTTGDVAAALGVSKRAVEMRAAKQAWPFQEETARGGRRRLYDAAQLPADIREALAKQQLATVATPVVVRAAQHPIAAVRKVEDLAEWRREIGMARAAIIDEIDRLASHGGVNAAVRVFLHAAATGALSEPMRQLLRTANARRGAGDRTVSRARLLAWRATAKRAQSPLERIALLAPHGGGRKWTLTNDVAAVLALYRQPNKPSLLQCAQQVALQTATSASALYARARREIEKTPAPVFYEGRHTGTALRAMRPFIRRDTSKLLPNDVWIGDGHGAKVRIAHPDSGLPFVPEVTVIMDIADRMVVGWSVALSEHCLAVADALRHAMSRHGIPGTYYSDNGAGQKNKMFDAPITGVLSVMGVEHKTGIPGNPQGRGLIERFWQTALLPLAKRFQTYQGKDADRDTLRLVSRDIDKTLRLARRGELATLPGRLPTFTEFIEALNQSIDFYNTHHRHRSLPKLDGVYHATPAEYRERLLVGTDIDIPSPSLLATMFMPSVLRTAKRGEVRLWNGVYYNADLMLVDGEQVQVAYDIHDATRVWVKKITGELIACAELGGNRVGYFPQTFVEQQREKRAEGRLKRLHSKIEDVHLELRASTLPSISVSAEDTQEDAAERAALAAEMQAAAADDRSDDEESDGWGQHRRYRRIREQLAAGAEVMDADRHWCESYEQSSDCRAFERMAEDFPEMLEERASA